MSTAKNFIEALENQIGVPNAFGSQELDKPRMIDVEENGVWITRPMTLQEEVDFDQMFQDELEADHADDDFNS